MKDKKNILIAVLVVVIVAILIPGLLGFIGKALWFVLKFVVVGLGILVLVSLIMKKRNS